jgi:hypothetical protein
MAFLRRRAISSRGDGAHLQLRRRHGGRRRPDQAAAVTAALEAAGETAFPIGSIAAGTKGCTVRGSVETWSAKAPWSATHHG